MIHSLRGILLKKSPERAVVETGGVGFAVTLPASAYGRLPETGEGILLHTHLVLREDGVRLFGFPEERERDAFAELLEIPNVGPKVALSILSTFSPDTLALVVVSGDPKRLAEVPGIGKKTAEKLLLELRDRYEKLFGGKAKLSAGDLPPVSADAPAGRGNAAECRAALVSLGFSALEIERRLRAIPDLDKRPVEETIRRFLQAAARGDA